MSTSRRRLFLTLALAGILSALPVAAAPASTVSVLTSFSGGTVLDVTALPGEVNDVTVAQTANKTYTVTDTAGVTGCTVTGTSTACNVGGGLDHVAVHLGDGDDRLDALGSTVSVYAYGGDGADDITGGTSTNFLNGEGGDDRFGATASLVDFVNGGDGSDTVSYAGSAGAVNVTPGVGWDDGMLGEMDSIGGDVENVVGSSLDDHIVGTSAANTLSGGAGIDTIDAGSGADTIDGGDGDDVLTSRDAGTSDVVACGAGTDALVADREDVLDACETLDLPPLVLTPVTDLTAAGTGTGGTGTMTPDPGATSTLLTPPTQNPITAIALRVGPVTIDSEGATLTGDGRRLALTVSCAADAVDGCQGTIVVRASLARAATKAVAARRGVRQRSVELGSVRFRLRAGKTKKVSARISRRGVTRALKNTKPTKSGKKPVKRLKATMTVSVRSGKGKPKTVESPLVIDVPQKR